MYNYTYLTLKFTFKIIQSQAPYYKTESNIALYGNFTLELSGNAMSMRWKPRTSTADNVISFTDGQGVYSSTYFVLDALRKKDDLLPHIVLGSDPTSLSTSSQFTNLRYT